METSKQNSLGEGAVGICVHPEIAQEVATIAKALSHEGRVMVLASLVGEADIKLSEIVEGTDFTFQSLQRHVNSLVDAGLIEKGDNKGEYILTKDGKSVAKLLCYFLKVPRVSEKMNDVMQEMAREALKVVVRFITEPTFRSEVVEKLNEVLELMKKDIEARHR
jgi:DNA-binding transcriptional ArsR family regulator